MLEASRWHNDHMEIVDQTRLPHEVAVVRMETLEEELLKFSNDIRLPDDITIIEVRYFG